jgi:X-Pro dipeptidyl-peptidase
MRPQAACRIISMRWTLLAALALAGVLAGCIAGEDLDAADAEAANATGADPPPVGAEGIDEDLLTEDRYDVLPQEEGYVDASTPDAEGDDVELYVEVYKPDGEGPWPVILESSPYNLYRANGELSELTGHGLVETYVPKGYVVVLAHVRGTGNSEGCMDMMGPREQADQADLVGWAAEQGFSNGKVAMHGFSYVGTTPHEAAIQDPEGLEAIVTGAGVTNQWRNVYQNGVPYEGRHYPITYQAGQATPPPTDVERGPAWAENTAKNACGQRDALQAMSPGTYEKGVYTEYWDQRNLTKGADDVTAPMLYTQGFTDRAVNPMESIGWFNEVDAPKKGLFHQLGHTYPPRDDYATIEHAWFDRWLKGIENGVTETAPVEVQTNTGEVRTGETWPPEDATPRNFTLGETTLTTEPAEAGEVTYLADMARNPTDDVSRLPEGTAAEDAYHDPAKPAGLPSTWTWTSEPFDERVHAAGPIELSLTASVDAENTYFLFDVYDVRPNGEATWLAEGWFNAHLREGFDTSAPLTPGEAYEFPITFEPREWVFEEGHRLVLEVSGHDGRVFPIDEPATVNTVHTGAASQLTVPVLEDPTLREGPG